MDALQTTNPKFGYNVSPRAGSQLGYRHNDESRRKMSEAGQGRKLPEEWRQSIADSMNAKGITHSQGERNRLSARRARLQKGDLYNVLDMYEEGITQEEISKQFAISILGIHKIIRGLSYHKWGEEWCQYRGVSTLPSRTRANVKFSKKEVFDILDRDRSGELRQAIAAIYDVTPSNITQICQGRFYPKWYEEWRRIRSIALSERNKRKIKKLSEHDVRNILEELASGIKQRDIAKKYGVSAPTICDVKEGRTHKTAKRKRVP